MWIRNFLIVSWVRLIIALKRSLLFTVMMKRILRKIETIWISNQFGIFAVSFCIDQQWWSRLFAIDPYHFFFFFLFVILFLFNWIYHAVTLPCIDDPKTKIKLNCGFEGVSGYVYNEKTMISSWNTRQVYQHRNSAVTAQVQIEWHFF